MILTKKIQKYEHLPLEESILKLIKSKLISLNENPIEAYGKIVSNLIRRSYKMNSEYIDLEEGGIINFLNSKEGRFICWNIVSLAERMDRDLYSGIRDLSVRSIFNNLRFTTEAYCYSIAIKEAIAEIIKTITSFDENGRSSVFIIHYPLNIRERGGIETLSRMIQKLYDEYEELSLADE